MQVNHIAEKQGNPAETVTSATSSRADSKWFLILVFLALLIHAWIAYAHRPFETTFALELLFGVINFVVILAIYYGVSRLAYSSRFVLIGLFAALAISAGAILSKEVTVMTMASGWAAVLISSILCGVLVAKQIPLQRVYAIALLVLAAIVAVQLFPLWSKMISSATDVAEALMSDIGETLTLGGYTKEQIQSIAENFKSFYAGFVRVLPSFSIMAAMFQFSIGFWLFVRWLNRTRRQNIVFPEFINWKMPFVLTPFLVAVIIMRLFGNDLIILIADNLLLILAVFYAITGIALIEFYMKRFRFAILSRVLVYLLFLLTHVVGFALLTLLGFIDSFFDWRRKYPLPLGNKTG